VDVPPLIHFYHPGTGVSLELPIGFLAVADDERSATYGLTDDDEESVLALVVVQLLAAVEPGAETAAVQTTVEAFASSHGDQVEERIEVVDDCPTRTVVVHLPNGMPGSEPIATRDILVHFTAVAFGHGLRTISAFAPWAERDHWIDIFDEAVASCRFL
jgi:hypothetical protein